jgi:UDP-N-acetylmuramoylalanine--D-glutamate ligase
MQTFSDEVKGKKVLVFGLGQQGGGVGDANWLVRQGAHVRVTDQKSETELSAAIASLDVHVERSLGAHVQADIDWADMLIKNPGVPDEHPLLSAARSASKPVLTSITVFVKYAGIKTIGITGTRGKSTTTALITKVLERAFPDQVITGGHSPGTSGLSLFDSVESKQYAVLELSSFQLHNFHELHVSPSIAVVTNLYPDHLNRYTSMETYRRDKEAIVAYQKTRDITLANSGNAGALEISKASTGQVTLYSAEEVSAWETSLPGTHNRENIAAARAVGLALDIPEDLIKQVVRDFHGLPYRQEVVRVVNEVTYINDTTATTPVAAQKAIAAQTKPVTLICGGASKNLPFDDLVTLIAQSELVTQVILLGSKQIPEFVTALKDAAEGKVIAQVDSMHEAVQVARERAKPNSVVLLSPGFASFDLFQNEFDRGRQFSDAVAQL